MRRPPPDAPPTELLRALVDAALARKGKQRGVEISFSCPNEAAHTHGDRNPSASLNAETGLWTCHGCGLKGNASDLAKRFGIDTTRYGTRRPPAGAQRPPKRLPATSPVSHGVPAVTLPTPDDLARYAQELLKGDSMEASAAREHLTKSGTDLARCGWGVVERKGRWFITIPVYGLDGELADVRLYAGPFGGDPKMLSWAAGHGSARPYGWHDLPPNADSVLWVEGERDCETLRAHGAYAVTNTNGAKAAAGVARELPEELVRGRRFICLFDHDDAGRDGAVATAQALIERGAQSARVAHWPDALPDGTPTPSGFDASDWFAGGSDASALQDIVINAAKPPLPDHTTADKMMEAFGEQEWVWRPWLPGGQIVVLGGRAGVGKSAFALDLVRRVVSGESWPDGTPGSGSPEYVLWLETEGFQGGHADRMRSWGVDASKIVLLGSDGCETVRLDDKEGADARSKVRDLVRYYGIRLVVLDALRRAHRMKENDSELAMVLAEWQDLARDEGFCFLILHHMRKDQGGKPTLDDLRGTSVIGDVARSALGVWRPNEAEDVREVVQMKPSLVSEEEAQATICFDWPKGSQLCYNVERPLPAELAAKPEWTQTIMRVLQEAHDRAEAARAAGEDGSPYVSGPDLRRELGIDESQRATFSRFMAQLVAKGRVIEGDRHGHAKCYAVALTIRWRGEDGTEVDF